MYHERPVGLEWYIRLRRGQTNLMYPAKALTMILSHLFNFVNFFEKYLKIVVFGIKRLGIGTLNCLVLLILKFNLHK